MGAGASFAMSPTTSISLAERYKRFELQRKKQSKAELLAFVGIFAAMALGILFLPHGRTFALIYAIATIVAFLALGIVIGANTKRARREAGLICPSCKRLLDTRDVLHIVTNGSCKHCNAEVRQ